MQGRAMIRNKSASSKVISVHLKFWLPVTVVVGGVLLFFLLAALQYYRFQQDLTEFMQQTVRVELDQVAEHLERLPEKVSFREAQSMLKKLEKRHTLTFAIWMDAEKNILASLEPSWVGQSIAAVLSAKTAQQILSTKSAESRHLMLDKKGWQVIGVARVTSFAERTENMQGHVLVVGYGLTAQLHASWQQVKQQSVIIFVGISVAVFALILFGRLFIFMPVHALRQGMKSIGEGEFDNLPTFIGRGEFATLGADLKRMASELSDRARALVISEARFRQLSQASQEAIIFHDGGIISDLNNKVTQIFGWKYDQLIGQPLINYIAPHQRKLTLMRMERYPEGLWNLEVLHLNGESIPCEVSVRQEQIGDRVLRVVAMRDIRERLEAEETIRRLSHFDLLTGLTNRQFLMAQLQAELEGVERHQNRAALAVINLNNFKSINDSLGMSVGDEVLKQVAQRLSVRLERGQHLSRVDGDTFAVVLTRLQGSLERASLFVAGVIEQLLDVIEEQVLIGEHSLHLTGSAGIVMMPNDNKEPAELLREAETAMHQVKGDVDTRVHFFAHRLQEAANQRLMMRNDLRAAIESGDQLLLHYQPQVRNDGTLHGVEALVRWQHPKHGLIPPFDFIPAAEENGLIVPLGNWVLKEAASALKRWQHCAEYQDWSSALTMAVNVSPRQFREKDIIDRIESILAEVGVDAMSFELELTESVVAGDLDLTVEKMERLRRLGVRFALDDFGTGYSSLSYLKKLPIDTLKIDRSFVMEIDAPQTSSVGKRPAALVDAIVAMSEQMSMNVLAEGVETAEQLEYLQAIGCDYFQGYYFSRPLSEEQLISWIRARGSSVL